MRFRAQVPCLHSSRSSKTETNSYLCGGEGVCRVKKEETRKCQMPFSSVVGLSFPLLWYSSSQSPIWIGYTLPGAPIQCQPHTSSGRHRLKPNVSVHRPLTPRCSFSLTFCRAFLGLLSESGTGGGLGNPWKGAGSPEPRWQFAPLHFHICPPFVGKGSSTLWCGWLSGIRSPPVTLGVNPISVAVRWKGSGRGRGEA